MSCVAELNAMRARHASEVCMNASVDRDIARHANAAPAQICVPTTKNFFVFHISMKGLHKNFSAHGGARIAVYPAIFASDSPKLLYTTTETVFTATKGSPSAT